MEESLLRYVAFDALDATEMEKWLNERAEEGYEIIDLTSAASPEGDLRTRILMEYTEECECGCEDEDEV